jgi:hypothetical protein
MAELQAQMNALQEPPTTGPRTAPRRTVAAEEEEEEEEEEESSSCALPELCDFPTNYSPTAANEAIDSVRDMTTFKFNKLLKPLLFTFGFNTSVMDLVAAVVGRLHPNLSAIDFTTVVSAVCEFRMDNTRLVCSQRVRDLKGYIRTELYNALMKLDNLAPVPEVLSEKSLSTYPPFKVIQKVYRDGTGGAFPTIEFTVLGLIEVGDILEVSSFVSPLPLVRSLPAWRYRTTPSPRALWTTARARGWRSSHQP